jgi:hypothetical protein
MGGKRAYIVFYYVEMVAHELVDFFRVLVGACEVLNKLLDFVHL